jgi:two-component system sensor histidine kinase/response regulator
MMILRDSDQKRTSRSVLVVDDDVILREVMSEQLSTLGWSVATAEHGEAAVALLQRDVPDLVVLDLNMPHLDGFGLLRHIRQNPRTIDLPVIVCTSQNDPEAINKAYRLGASSFITKPINWTQFLHHAPFLMRHGETERALRAAQAEALAASRTKSAMFQVLSHELKTPLTALIGLTSIMQTRLQQQGDVPVPEQMDHVVEAAQRLNSIVSDILLLSKAVGGGEHQQFSDMSIAELLEDGFAGLKAKAAARNVRLLVRPGETEFKFLCEPRLLRQALAKLADNAVRFSPEGGTVELWGHLATTGDIIVSVKDHGPGLSPKKIAECLQPFMQENMGYSRPAEGLGLGLPIAKAIAEAHGGELKIHSAPGKGLISAIVLPAHLRITPGEVHRG